MRIVASSLAVLLSLCLGGMQYASAQKLEWQVLVRNVTPVSTKEFNFIIAADPRGSDSLDKNLGEVEIPDLPLPGDVFYVWTIAPIPEVIWLSPKEYRKLIVGTQHLEVYDLRVNWTGGVLEFAWPYPPPMYIDSIVVTDGYTTYPDNLLYAKVSSGTKLATDNTAFEKFRVMVWYNTLSLGVDENESSMNPRIWPMPATDVLNIDTESNLGSQLEIIDYQGATVTSMRIESPLTSIQLSGISSGVYSLRLIDRDGSVKTTTFVHL